jgi:hypothetical protein
MRRVWIRVAIFAVVLVVALVAWFFAGGAATLFRWAVTPRSAFAATPHPPAPDYSDPANWAALPGREDDADVVPAGVTPSDQMAMPADVFFIHPTTYFGRTHWNQPLDDEKVNRRTDRMPIRNQASVFNGCCRVYAPRFRQATLGAFFQKEGAMHAPLEFAYEDVKRAFGYYAEHFNEGRPFIVASHSQGSVYAPWLLEDMIDRTPLADRFVAGYLVGFVLPEEWISQRLANIGVCRKADDTRCVVAWSTYAEGAQDKLKGNTTPFADASNRYGDHWERVGTRTPVCVNPLSWASDGASVAPSLNLGGWAIPNDVERTSAPAPDPNLTGARCLLGGLLISPEPREFVKRNKIQARNRNYHNLDYQLFYMNIRENAKTRVAAFGR